MNLPLGSWVLLALSVLAPLGLTCAFLVNQLRRGNNQPGSGQPDG